MKTLKVSSVRFYGFLQFDFMDTVLREGGTFCKSDFLCKADYGFYTPESLMDSLMAETKRKLVEHNILKQEDSLDYSNTTWDEDDFQVACEILNNEKIKELIEKQRKVKNVDNTYLMKVKEVFFFVDF